jgi:23S rRNA (cytosine1962-C5)-methyltransferase
MQEKIRWAIAKREVIRAGGTNALRIVDGPCDGFDDLEIDDFDGRWLVQTRQGLFPEWLRGMEGPASIYWKRLGDKTSPEWISGEKVNAPFQVRENGVICWIDFQSGYSQGLFLDQRLNRAELREMAAGKKVLNCFAYTCAFGLHAALGGGLTTNVDLSRQSLDWGTRNYEANGLNPADHEFLPGDVAEWLKRFGKKDRRFDIVVLDPPTFSRNRKGETFRVEKDFGKLARVAADLLEPGGFLFCSTNQRTLHRDQFRALVTSELEGKWRVDFRPMPPDFTAEPYLKAGWVKPLSLY